MLKTDRQKESHSPHLDESLIAYDNNDNFICKSILEENEGEDYYSGLSFERIHCHGA